MAKNRKMYLGAVNISPNTIANTTDVLLNEENGYVNFGLDNRLHYYFADSVQHSPTHGAIIDFKRTVTHGNGLDLDNISDTNLSKQLDKASILAASDLAIFETYNWLLTTNVYGDIVEVRALPSEGVRVSDINPNTGIPFNYFFSYNWAKNLNIKKYDAFNPNEKKPGQFILQKRIVKPNQYFYTVPSYYSASRWIDLENKIAIFHANNIDSGFFPTVIMEFFGDEPDDAAKVELENKIQSKFGGANGQKLFTIFTEDGQDSTNITTFNPPDLPNYFEKLMSEISAKIMTSHRIPAILVGIKEVGKTGLGSNSEEIQASYLLYESTSISPYRSLILEGIDEILQYNETPAEVMYKDFMPSFGDIKTTKGKRTDLE